MEENVKLILGNCLDYLGDFPDESVDMILIDPPYGTTNCKWDSVIDIKQLFTELKRIVKENGTVVCFSQLPFGAKVVAENLDWFRYEIIWEKANAVGFLNANRMPLRAHENILVFYKKMPIFHPQKSPGNPYRRKDRVGRLSVYDEPHRCPTVNDTGDRYPRDVIYFPRDQHGVHPTQKPVDLLCWLIRSYTDEDDIVLDCCMGSGSTGVACKKTGRRFIGIEKDNHFFKIAEDRINGC